MFKSKPLVGSTYVPQGVFAYSHRDRRRGLSRQDLCPETPIMIFPKCRSVHTFGMRFDLRVIFLDKEDIVLGVKDVKPRCVVFAPKRTHTIVEVPIR